MAGRTLAQDAVQPTAPAQDPKQEAKPAQDPRATPPQVVLGQRVLQVQHVASVCNTVVIVSDAPSYVGAIAKWTPVRKFPVLIDDGTPAARENIARFVRAFKPAHVVRWSAHA